VIKNDVSIGLNRTGIELHLKHKKELLEDVAEAEPSSDIDGAEMDQVRAQYGEEAGAIGSVPPPANIKGAAKAVIDTARGTNLVVLLDKLGERLAFERTGTRLYEALIAKHDIADALPYGPTRAELVEIHEQELAHFELLWRSIISVGGDPTAVTPSADVTAISSTGILQVISDPRTTMLQALNAILTAELVDNDQWTILGELALSAGHDDIALEFQQAIFEEQDHLKKVRAWVRNSTLAQKSPIGLVIDTVKEKVAQLTNHVKRR
jgi:hypothetical protein